MMDKQEVFLLVARVRRAIRVTWYLFLAAALMLSAQFIYEPNVGTIVMALIMACVALVCFAISNKLERDVAKLLGG